MLIEVLVHPVLGELAEGERYDPCGLCGAFRPFALSLDNRVHAPRNEVPRGRRESARRGQSDVPLVGTAQAHVHTFAGQR